MWTKYPEVYDELRLVEDLIRKNVCSRNRLLAEVSDELLDAGGKRLRPAFVILAAKFGRYNRQKVLSVAGAIEILHTATLVHDDVIDRSKLRRGRVTVSEKYGADMAVYTGDFLYTKAVLMLSRDISIEKLDMVARAIKTICEGEVDQYRDRYNIDTSTISYIKRISRKTAMLFGAACTLGAYLAKCTDNTARALAKFGFFYGMAFQIRDDLNDLLSDEAISGKPVGKDIMEGTMTLPVIYALSKSNAIRGLLNKSIENKEKASVEEISRIAGMVKEHGGIEYTQKVLERYIGKGMKVLEALPGNKYRTVFMDLICELRL